MKAISDILAILTLLAGFIFAGLALLEISIAFTPVASSASAVQLTQIYTQGTFYAVMSVSSFLFTAIVFISKVTSAIERNIEAISANRMS